MFAGTLRPSIYGLICTFSSSSPCRCSIFSLFPFPAAGMCKYAFHINLQLEFNSFLKGVKVLHVVFQEDLQL